MAVCNSHWDCAHFGQHQYVSAEMVYVAMDHVVRSVLAKDAQEVSCVSSRIGVAEATDNASAQRAYFFVVRTGLRGVHEKVHLVFLAVDMTQYLDQPSLNSTAVQFPEHVQNTHQADCLFIADSKTTYPAVARRNDAISNP